MKIYAASINFWPLVFTCDFFNGITSNLNLSYNTIDNDQGTAPQTLSITLSFKTQVIYSTYPSFTILSFCSISQKGPFPCTAITGTCDSTNNFCYDNGIYFWCNPTSAPKNYYMDMTLLSCGTTCPINYTRLPDSVDSSAYCLWNCVNSQNSLCPNTATNIKSAQYILSTNFSCNSNFSKISYYCSPSANISKSIKI